MPVRPKRYAPAAAKTIQHQPADQQRGTSTQRGYGYRWQQARAGYLRKHPLCVECEKLGRVEPATDLDHITPHRGDNDLFWDRSNWQPLCHPCHSRKTATEDGGWGNARR
ncbi:HNH endonuclease [Pseudomonas sp. Fl4BN1]|uniref:HNH endonuclease n=1 Tax=Pseudomonas sp. Fl4BN1 TaxID=2697651 RepID=UPI001378C49D|nr:HNH endonuclease signature motif containing protein [Pseudomonas sp. Fl4BN1]NBF13078.1 HNH endonuclease [Pseudomonas sp. Fl4BN1]